MGWWTDARMFYLAGRVALSITATSEKKYFYIVKKGSSGCVRAMVRSCA